MVARQVIFTPYLSPGIIEKKMRAAQKSQKISNNRFRKILLSSGSAIFLKLAVFLCSFVITKLIIKYYGSEVNGTINSIVQFLGIITLLEGGIGGVAKAALFKPLANKDGETIKKNNHIY